MAVVTRFAHWLCDVKPSLTLDELIRDLVITAGSFVLVCLISFFWNLIAATPSLDKDRQADIDALTARVKEAESVQKQRDEKKALEVKFAGLIRTGREIVDKFARCGAPSELENFKVELETWKSTTNQELEIVGPLRPLLWRSDAVRRA